MDWVSGRWPMGPKTYVKLVAHLRWGNIRVQVSRIPWSIAFRRHFYRLPQRIRLHLLVSVPNIWKIICTRLTKWIRNDLCQRPEITIEINSVFIASKCTRCMISLTSMDRTLNKYGKNWWIRSRWDLSLTAWCISVKYCSAFTRLYGEISPHCVSQVFLRTSRNSASASGVKCPSATKFLANTWKSS